jgi:hypothetical protein
MPRVFNWFSADNFPKIEIGKKIVTGNEFEQDDFPKAAHSSITFLGNSDNVLYKKYFVEHETTRNIKYRIDKDIRKVLIVINEFEIFQHNKGYYFVNTNIQDLRELAYRMKAFLPDALMHFGVRTIDLLSLKDEIEKNKTNAEIWGGFFRDLQINRVTAASIFGHDVGDSDLWDTLSSKGNLSGVWINFEFYGEYISVMVTNHGGIVTFASLTEKVLLELVNGINELIKPFAKEVNLSSPKRRHK